MYPNKSELNPILLFCPFLKAVHNMKYLQKCLTKSGFLSTVISCLDILDGLIVKMFLTSIIINHQPIDVIDPEDIQQLTSITNHSPIDV